MQKVLLTGGAGFIGSHVADLLLEKGCDLTVIDNLSFGRREHLNAAATFATMDLIERDRVLQLVAEHRFDTIVHLAAIHFIPFCNQNPNLACRSNIEGTQNLLDAASAAGSVKRIFIASTAAVYPDMPGPIAETVSRAPMDVYGMTKSANEEQAAIHALRNETSVSIGRFFNAVGARETNPHLIPDILQRIKQSDRIEIGNVSPKRDYIDVRDMATAVVTMLDGNRGKLDTCNIGTGKSYDVEQITKLISDIHGREIHLDPSPRLIRKVERQNLQAQVDRIAFRYGWRARYSISDAVHYAYQWIVGGRHTA